MSLCFIAEEAKMKQIYVSDEVAELVKMFPKGMRTQVVDIILKDFLVKILDNATLNDLRPENFEEFYKRLIISIAFDTLSHIEKIELSDKEVETVRKLIPQEERYDGSHPNPKKHLKRSF